MTKRISLLLPTRGRPALVARFLRSIVAQSAHPELIEVILCVDSDDAESQAITFDGLTLKMVVVPRQTMGAYNSICLEHATGEIAMAVNDDIIVRTNAWDDKIREYDARYPDGVYLGYCNDLLKGSRLCTFPILSRHAWLPPGNPYPREYKGAFIDVHLMDIFKRLQHRGCDRIFYAEDIIFEHVHYRTNPEALDTTYTERLRFGDDFTFIALAESRRLEADRLLGVVSGEFPEQRHSPRGSAVEPTSPIGIWPLCAHQFLLDFDLPLGWRSYLFAWMVSRYYFYWIQRRFSVQSH